MRNNFERPSPVLLSSSFTVANGQTGVPDYSQLSYPFRKALAITEVRFDLYCASSGLDDLTSGSPQLGAIVYAKMQLGSHYLMRDYVPIWLLGTAMTQFEEGYVDNSLDTPNAYSHYRWLFPEPLYVEAGETLRTTLSRAEAGLTGIPQTTTSLITAQVSYVGRVVTPSEPRSRVIRVPYATSFVTTWGNTYQQSNEYHLFNPFDRPLRVQRMTGRVLTSDNLGADGKRLVELSAMTPGTAGSGISVQLYDSWGGKVVNDRTGPSDVWDSTRSAWTFDTVMPPKGMYEARVWNIGAAQQMHVAMLGVREERL